MPAVRIEFGEAALDEILAAERWYAERNGFASRAFESTIDAALIFIAAFPLGSPQYLGNTRRRVLRRFPFALIYTLTEDAALIVALAHSRRRPGYWRKRL